MSSKKQPEISVIVPVYNGEAYIQRTLDLILEQSFQNFELILVDDGSEDKSGEICDIYREKDNRIRTIHRKNGGPSAARNDGIQAACGKYITYIDSDDLVTTDYLDKLLGLMIRYRTEIAICEIEIVDGKGALPDRHQTESEEKVLTGQEALEQMLLGNIHGSSACGIMMTAAMSRKHPFPMQKYHEDDCVSFRYFQDASSVAVTTEPLYFYIQREGSIMHSGFGKITTDELDAGDYLAKACRNEPAAIKTAAIYKRFTNYCQVLIENENLKEKDPTVWKRVGTGLNEMKKTVARDHRFNRRYRRFAQCLMLGGIPLLTAVIRVLNRKENRAGKV